MKIARVNCSSCEWVNEVDADDLNALVEQCVGSVIHEATAHPNGCRFGFKVIEVEEP